MSTPETPDRRHSPRLPIRGDASLMTPHHKWPVHLLDLSTNGALVALLEPHQLDEREEAILTLELTEGDRVKLQGRVVHQKGHYIGLVCSPTTMVYHARLRELLEELGTAQGSERSLQEMLTDQGE